MNFDRFCIMALAAALLANSIGDFALGKRVEQIAGPDPLDCIEKEECPELDAAEEEDRLRQSMPTPPAKRKQAIRT